MDYSSQSLKGIRRPPLAVSVTKASASLALLGVLTMGLLLLAPILVRGFSDPDLWFAVTHADEYLRMLTSLSDQGLVRLLNYGVLLISSVLAALLLVLLSLRVMRIGLLDLAFGLRDWLRPHWPGRVPNDFTSLVPLHRLFREQTLGVYEAPTGRLQSLFGRSATFLTPAVRPAATRLTAAMGSRAKAVLGWSLLLAVLLSTPVVTPMLGTALGVGQQASGLLIGLIDASGIWLLMIPVGGLLAGCALSVGLSYLAVSALIPRREPRTESLYRATAYDGFGHPQQLLSRLPDLAKPLEWGGFRNRFQSSKLDERASSIVQDGGTFSASVFIEQQPQPIPSGVTTAAVLLFAAGWGLRLAAVIFLVSLLVPGPVLELLRIRSSETLFLLAPLYLVLMANLIGTSLKQGRQWLDEADHLFGILHFASEAVLIDLEGVITKSNLTVGRARDDSVESSNVVVRSDLTARFRAGRLLSEVERIDGPRALLGVSPSDVSEHWVATLTQGIASLRKGVAPIGVDVGSTELQQLVELNASAAALKVLGRQAPNAVLAGTADLLMRPRHSDERLAALDRGPLPDRLLTNDAAGDLKECPRCAELVRARARKCRFCGFELEVVDG